MSFQPDDDALYRDAIRPAIESLGIAPIRVDHDHFTGKVTNHIDSCIRTSYFVVGEMSRERPNCYYELGFAQALGRPTFLLIDDPKKIHFDVQDFPFLVYGSLEELKTKLVDRIIGAVLTQRDEPSDEDNRCGKFGRCALKNGRLLSAKITKPHKSATDLVLSVTALGGSKQLTGKVRFYLHDSYKPAVYVVATKDNQARLEIDAKGAFTVGAKCDDDETTLELNLATIPGAKPAFYRS